MRFRKHTRQSIAQSDTLSRRQIARRIGRTRRTKNQILALAMLSVLGYLMYKIHLHRTHNAQVAASVAISVAKSAEQEGSQPKVAHQKQAPVRFAELLQATRDKQEASPSPASGDLAESKPLPLDSSICLDCLHTLAAYLSAVNLEERLSQVHHPTITKTRLQQWFEEWRLGNPILGEPQSASQQTINGREVVQIHFACGSVPGGNYLAIFLQNGDKHWSLNWESFVGLSELPWSTLQRERPSQPTMIRTLIAHDSFFNGPFADESIFESFRLTSSDGTHTLHGYCRRTGETARHLKAIVGSSSDANASAQIISPVSPVTLRVMYPRDSGDELYVEIVDVIAPRWLLAE
jgi:hypothetical protein